MVWSLNSQGMKNRKSRESFCRSIFAIYIKDWSTFWYVNRCYVYFFCGKFLNMCMPWTTTYPLWQPGPPGLTFYGSGLACLSSWMGMVNADWLCSMRSGVFLQIKFIIFKGCPTKLHFFSLLHIISFLFCHFRSWDYPEHFGICFQLDRKSKTWFFILLNMYVSRIEWVKILISHSLHLQNSGILQTTMNQRVTWWKWILIIFKCKNEVPKQLGLEKQMTKMGSLVLFSYVLSDLWSLNCVLFAIFCWYRQKI